MNSIELEINAAEDKPPVVKLGMLSYDLDDRVTVARLLTDAGYAVRNESAANLERFEQRVTDDDWDLIFIDARKPIDLIAKIVGLAHTHSPDVPVFGITSSGQKNQTELMELGITDLFSAYGMQRVVSSVTREVAANADRKLAFEARRLQSAVKLAEDERTVLSEIGQLVSSSLDIGQIYSQMIEQIKRLIPLDTAAIAIADVGTDSITLEYVAGKPLEGFEQGFVMPMSGFTPASQLARFVLVLDTGLLEEMRSEFPGIAEMLDAGVRSIMAIPLVHSDEVVGFLATTSSIENAYGPDHVAIGDRIGAQIAAALANSRLHARISKIARTREILVQIGRDASAARDARELYTSVFMNLRKLIPIDRAVMAMTSDDGKALIIEHVEGIKVDGLALGQSVDLSNLVPNVLSEPRLTTVDNAQDQHSTDPTQGRLAAAGLPSNVRAPLRARDSVIGLITVSAKGERVYDPTNLILLERVSDQISPVIESLHLLERVQTLAATVETTLDLVAITDLEGVASYINPAGLSMLNIVENETGVGISLKDFMSPETAESIQNAGLRETEMSGGWQTEISVTPRDSERLIPVEMQLVPVKNKDGEMTAVNVFMRDLREREAGQVERREFVSTVSHELRTPLTSMKMYTDMLGEGDAGKLNEQQQRLVDNMKSTVDRLSRMVDDLNDVSLLEAGRFSLQIESLDIVELVASAIEMSTPIFTEHKMKVRADRPVKPVIVDVDRERMFQVMLNLLTNAAKYAEKGTETIVTISVVSDEVRVTVADKGPGIVADELETVFESFYRSKSARSSRVSGSGLGLSIARGFIEAQGGKIWAESTLGEGSTFIFTLPLAKS
jgi:signal transduction histidine kinase